MSGKLALEREKALMEIIRLKELECKILFEENVKLREVISAVKDKAEFYSLRSSDKGTAIFALREIAKLCGKQQ